ncbi:hypothetical protein Tco_1436578 [Tanacetum coccineum]
MTSLSFPIQVDNRQNNVVAQNANHQESVQYPSYIMRLMLTDLRFNITVFALDDVSIFAGSHSYVNNVRFHIVPNCLLAISDLEKLSSGTLLPTLEAGQSLMVTTTAGGFTPMRINYVRIKVPDVMRNLKIVVHSIYLPFPHLHPSAVSFDGEASGASGSGDVAPHLEQKNLVNVTAIATGSCETDQVNGSCAVAPSVGIAHPEVKPIVVRTEHQGL